MDLLKNCGEKWRSSEEEFGHNRDLGEQENRGDDRSGGKAGGGETGEGFSSSPKQWLLAN